MSSEEETLSPDEIEDEVFNTLPTLDVSELREIYSLLELECKEELEGKSKLLKYLLKYLCDVESLEDGGLSNILLIQKHLNKESDDLKDPSAIAKDIVPIVSGSKMDVMKLKDFKISGSRINCLIQVLFIRLKVRKNELP